jgi:predicted dinucleotide-binding enzyme
LVKTFNHLGYHQMEDLARPAGAADRIAVGVAGDDPAAVRVVVDFVERAGFERRACRNARRQRRAAA